MVGSPAVPRAAGKTSARNAVVGLVFAVAALFAGQPAVGHGVGTSQLRLRLAGGQLEGEWAVHLADARRAIGLDPQTGGEAGFAGLRARRAALDTYLVTRVALDGDGRSCPIAAPAAPLTWQRDLDEVVLPLLAACAAPPRRLAIRCDLLFDVDGKHRVYFSVEDARDTSVGVLRQERRAVAFDVRQLRPGADFLEFVREGIRHIWSGVDHILFLLALLLPAPLVAAGHGWASREGVGAAAREVLKVVTAFTAAHSVTLALSFYGLVTLPARGVEVAIALSVLAAAWNNLRPFLPGRAWAIAGAFGLVHGLGFAGALRNLSLPRHARGLALAAFNLGVELGQLGIVVAVLPLLYAASRQPFLPALRDGRGLAAHRLAGVAVGARARLRADAARRRGSAAGAVRPLPASSSAPTRSAIANAGSAGTETPALTDPACPVKLMGELTAVVPLRMREWMPSVGTVPYVQTSTPA